MPRQLSWLQHFSQFENTKPKPRVIAPSESEVCACRESLEPLVNGLLVSEQNCPSSFVAWCLDDRAATPVEGSGGAGMGCTPASVGPVPTAQLLGQHCTQRGGLTSRKEIVSSPGPVPSGAPDTPACNDGSFAGYHKRCVPGIKFPATCSRLQLQRDLTAPPAAPWTEIARSLYDFSPLFCSRDFFSRPLAGAGGSKLSPAK